MASRKLTILRKVTWDTYADFYFLGQNKDRGSHRIYTASELHCRHTWKQSVLTYTVDTVYS